MERNHQDSWMAWAIAFALLLSLAACGKSVEERWQEQYDLGQKYLSELDYEQAIISFTNAIEIDSNQVDAYAGRAEAYMQQRDYTAAISDYTSALEFDQSNGSFYIARGDAYIMLENSQNASDENYKNARADYQKGISLMDLTWELFEKLAEVFESHGDDEALDVLVQQAMEAFRDDARFQEWLQQRGYIISDDGEIIRLDPDQIVDDLEVYPMNGSEEMYFLSDAEKEERLRPAALTLESAGRQAEERGDDDATVKYYKALEKLYYSLGELDKCLNVRNKLFLIAGEQKYSPDGISYTDTFYGYTTKHNKFGQLVESYEWSINLFNDAWAIVNWEYDDNGKLIHAVLQSPPGQYFQEYGEVDFIYDSEGRISKAVYTGDYSTPTTEYKYDGNKVTAITSFPESHYTLGDVSETSFTINEYGAIQKIDQPFGTIYMYDEYGKPIYVE